MESKQVLVMRKMVPNCRTGKYCAQAGHAAVGAVFAQGQIDGDFFKIPLKDPFVREWVTGRFKKVTVYVETDEQLVEIFNQARKAGLLSSLIRDAGLTEFNGVPTLTCVAVGPDYVDNVDMVTKGLPLL